MGSWKEHFEEVAAAGRTARRVIHGENVRVDAHTYKRRMEICQACLNEANRPTAITCHKCGCVIRRKAWLVEFHCDAGKW